MAGSGDEVRRNDIPKSVPIETRAEAKPDLTRRLERAKRLAAAARRRAPWGRFLKERVGNAGPHLSRVDEATLFNHGLEWFAILCDTRRKRPKTRDRRLATSEARFAEASRLPLEVIRHVQDAVRQHFGEIEMGGKTWTGCRT